jgi:cytochrome c2
MRKTVLGLLLGLGFTSSAFAGPLGDAAKEGDVAEIERLLAAGTDANEDDPMASPLHWAAMNGHADAVVLLAAGGAELDAPSKVGLPLHAAARFDRVDAVRALLAAGANPNARDGDGYTPLMRAVANNRIAVVEALIAGGADVNAITIALERGRVQGPTIALHEANFLGHDEIAEILRAGGAAPGPPDVPTYLAKLGDPERGKELARTVCKICHTVAVEDEPTMEQSQTGPPLIGLIGRPVADLGFDYSEELIAYGGIWTPERVYAFALSPMLTVPGTHMNWAPDRTPEMIADIVAFFVLEAD